MRHILSINLTTEMKWTNVFKKHILIKKLIKIPNNTVITTKGIGFEDKSSSPKFSDMDVFMKSIKQNI